MGTITQTIVLNDKMSNVFSKIQAGAVDNMKAFERLSKEADDLAATLNRLENINPNIRHTESYIQANRALMEMTERLDQAAAGEIKLAQEAEKTTRSFSAADMVIGNIATKIISMGANGVRGFMSMSDAAIQTNARLSMVANNLEVNGNLQEKIVQSANRSRVAYTDYANTIASLGNQASDAFSNTDELIAFGETLNKMFTVSGLDSNGISSVMYNLTQSLSTGKLLGNDYRILKQNAPQMIRILQDYYGVNREQLDKMVSDGKVAAQDLKAAMMGAAGDINKQFEEMPMTIQQATTIIKNNLIQSMQPIFEMIAKVTQAVMEHWDTIGPILAEAAVALGAIAGAWMAVTVAAKIAEAGGWAALTPYLLLFALVGGFILLVNLVAELLSNLFGETVSALGLITGGILATGAIIADIVIGLVNLIIDSINGVYQAANAWAAGMVALFGLLVSQIIQDLQPLIAIFDELFGSDLGAKFAGFEQKVWNKAGELWDEAQDGEIVGRLDYVNPAEAFNKGYDWGANVFNKNDGGGGAGFDDLMKGFDGITAPAAGGGKAVKTTTDDDLLSDEDIQMLLDIATRDYQLNYQQMTPNISVTFGDVRETADVDSVLEAVGSRVEELISGDAEVKN